MDTVFMDRMDKLPSNLHGVWELALAVVLVAGTGEQTENLGKKSSRLATCSKKWYNIHDHFPAFW